VKVKPLSLMVSVPGGTFLMGSQPREQGRKRDEQPHPVTVGPFLIGSTDVTEAQWQRVMVTNPSQFKGDDLPVQDVTWYDAVAYCNKLSQLEGKVPAYTVTGTNVTWNRAANGYRLPTEAEWEWAARGGAQNNNNLYAGSSWLDEVSWHKDNSGKTPHPVGQKKANDLGLYDMSGNVWQWCWDWYGNYGPGAQTDPQGPPAGTVKVARGGNWASPAAVARVADRSFAGPGSRGGTLGFRVVCTLVD
jgi:formylglycine-generating enzyme required for sulfatase activity